MSADLNGNRVTQATILVPYSGVWVADVDLEQQASLPTAALGLTLQIGTLQLKGTLDPIHSGTFGMRTRCRVVGGYGGWSKRLKPRGYHNDLGVSVRDLAQDIAKEVGETLAGPLPTHRLGADFLREVTSAGRMFDLILGSSGWFWWVDYQGQTHFGTTRAAVEVTVPHELLNYDVVQRTAEISTDDPVGIGIGSVLRAKLDSPLTIKQIEAQLGKALRLYCWGAA